MTQSTDSPQERMQALHLVLFPLVFIPIAFCVVGIIWFPANFLLKGDLFDGVMSIVCLIGCCVPALLEFIQEGHIDLRPRFLK